jgi:hypothetical protein
MVASLLRAVPPTRFGEAKSIFLRIRDEWRVPLEVANDGDVTALAGAMSLKANALLGIAMGSSEAAGYPNPKGGMTGWLSELAFAGCELQTERRRRRVVRRSRCWRSLFLSAGGKQAFAGADHSVNRITETVQGSVTIGRRR